MWDLQEREGDKVARGYKGCGMVGRQCMCELRGLVRIVKMTIGFVSLKLGAVEMRRGKTATVHATEGDDADEEKTSGNGGRICNQ